MAIWCFRGANENATQIHARVTNYILSNRLTVAQRTPLSTGFHYMGPVAYGCRVPGYYADLRPWEPGKHFLGARKLHLKAASVRHLSLWMSVGYVTNMCSVVLIIYLYQVYREGCTRFIRFYAAAATTSLENK